MWTTFSTANELPRGFVGGVCKVSVLFHSGGAVVLLFSYYGEGVGLIGSVTNVGRINRLCRVVRMLNLRSVAEGSLKAK
jgi:hypothetical protein